MVCFFRALEVLSCAQCLPLRRCSLYVVGISDHGGQGSGNGKTRRLFCPSVFLITRSWLLYALASSLASKFPGYCFAYCRYIFCLASRAKLVSRFSLELIKVVIDRGSERPCFEDWDRGNEGPCNCAKATILHDS